MNKRVRKLDTEGGIEQKMWMQKKVKEHQTKPFKYPHMTVSSVAGGRDVLGARSRIGPAARNGP